MSTICSSRSVLSAYPEHLAKECSILKNASFVHSGYAVRTVQCHSRQNRRYSAYRKRPIGYRLRQNGAGIEKAVRRRIQMTETNKFYAKESNLISFFFCL